MQLMHKTKKQMQQLSLLGRTHVPRCLCWLNFINPIRSNLIQLLEFALPGLTFIYPCPTRTIFQNLNPRNSLTSKYVGTNPFSFAFSWSDYTAPPLPQSYIIIQKYPSVPAPVSEKVIFVVVTSCHIAIALVSATCSQLQIKKRKKKQDIHANDPHFGLIHQIARWKFD